MKNDDAQLIQRVLAGDETAFSALVGKYRRSVHALAWRKIGDFHIADVYRLENENGTWREIASEIPNSVTSLAVDGKVLHVGTQNSGMLRFNLEK